MFQVSRPLLADSSLGGGSGGRVGGGSSLSLAVGEEEESNPVMMRAQSVAVLNHHAATLPRTSRIEVGEIEREGEEEREKKR